MNNPIVVIDNGASTIKVGTVNGEREQPRIIPNAVVRSKGDKTTYFGHEFANCKDYSSLHYRLPFEKGYLVDWDAQKAVWDGIFSSDVLAINTTDSSLLITEPYFNLPNIQDTYDQLIFEEYEFESCYRCTPASLIPYGTLFNQPGLPSAECMIVIDSGFSYTHVVPILQGKVIWKAVKRLDVGGKLLTNQLKELVSFRQWNMMDETYIMNDVKESCCYVSTNFKSDLEMCRANPKTNPIVQEYILPDLSTNRKGHIRQPDDIVAETDQILVMNNERFTVPEPKYFPHLFITGLHQSGLSATIALSISLLPPDLQGMFWANIGLIGGNTKFPGFRSRLMSELQSQAPVDCEVVIYECNEYVHLMPFIYPSTTDIWTDSPKLTNQPHRPSSPITEAYRAAVCFASMPGFTNQVVTRAEYIENGSSASRRKFHDWKPHEAEKERPTKEAAKAKGKQKEDDRSQAPLPPGSKPTRTRSKPTISSSAPTTRRR
ncbi:Actin-like protein ARP6 [Hypsizygus marmoreus]|uniref:Actin-like protein ARP6 n=1 Tax=Hypsizygus marmoreus TaxID=39966 RepID=A0A369J0P3_HYPMA|nr:Actin-like protein ARP6 [Hypsizygus marmoreus]